MVTAHVLTDHIDDLAVGCPPATNPHSHRINVAIGTSYLRCTGTVLPSCWRDLGVDATHRIQICGPLIIEHDGLRVEGLLPGRQGRLAFTHLVAHRHRQIAATNWPKRSGPTAHPPPPTPR